MVWLEDRIDGRWSKEFHPGIPRRDARFSLLVCAVRERFRLVPYRSFDVDCFIGIHGILLPPLAKAIQTPNLWNSLFRLCPDDENCLKHKKIRYLLQFSHLCCWGKRKIPALYL